MENSKFIVYQMLPRIVGKFGTINDNMLSYLKDMGVTYIWYTGIIRHATPPDPTVKGTCGSPYAINDYYDVNPYLADNPQRRMDEFEELAERTHENGLKLLIDFVPNHTAANYIGKHREFTDENYYPGHIHDGDWTDTAKLNYSNPDTRSKMLEILLFWASKGVDGFRCDMVELVPLDFWSWAIPKVKSSFPDTIFIGEAYTPSNYPGLFEIGKFDYLYDKSGFYDTLKRIVRGEGSATELTGCWQSLGPYAPKMLNFLENHDEVRVGSEEFAGSPYRAISALFVSLFFNTCPFMIYFGQQFGEGPEKTSIFDFCTLPSIEAWKKGLEEDDAEKYLEYSYRDLRRVYNTYLKVATRDKAFRDGKTFDLQYVNPHTADYNPHRQFAFLRSYGSTVYLCVANFEDRDVALKINIPASAFDYMGIVRSESVNPETPISIKVTRNAGHIIEL